ncbi:hypothetical protein MAPG_11277 [Magnaporthiopsis poae ATCC 64411]|uniref:Uncharacterized protein n=1 Tax=Magnaporthiopsis poae (strain ATCC 64411 / 73-15) TaxID=644358 RepID=A0A0C4EEU6_MAGP6|nr:hypothetical protein MAPG_11277 [Magnaporthiopsis poae ATCC 64411]
MSAAREEYLLRTGRRSHFRVAPRWLMARSHRWISAFCPVAVGRGLQPSEYALLSARRLGWTWARICFPVVVAPIERPTFQAGSLPSGLGRASNKQQTTCSLSPPPQPNPSLFFTARINIGCGAGCRRALRTCPRRAKAEKRTPGDRRFAPTYQDFFRSYAMHVHRPRVAIALLQLQSPLPSG